MDLIKDRLMQLQMLNEMTGEKVVMSEEDYFLLLDDFFKNSVQNPSNDATPSYLLFYSYNGITSFSYNCIHSKFIRFGYLKNLYNHGVTHTKINNIIRYFLEKYFDIKNVKQFDHKKESKMQQIIGGVNFEIPSLE